MSSKSKIGIGLFVILVLAAVTFLLISRPPRPFSLASVDPQGRPEGHRKLSPSSNGATTNSIGAVTPHSIQHAAAFAADSFSLPPINSRLVDIVDALQKAADAGSPKAACRLAFELNRCARHSMMKSGAARLEEEVRNSAPDSKQFRRFSESLRNTKAQLENSAIACSDFKDSRIEAWKYSYAAAMSGHGPSMIRFVAERTGLDERNPSNTAEGWVVYRNYAPALLTRALEMGVPEAYAFAAVTHLFSSERQSLLSQDPVRALAYSRALQQVATQDYRGSLEINNTHTLNTWKLSDQQQAEANALALQLADRLRASGVNEVDLSRGLFGKSDGSHCAQ